MTRVLDCTLRDGGYYNDWNFSLDTARQTVDSLNRAGVDIIEIGLKSAFDEKCSGLFKYCNEDYLGFLKEFPDASFSFMLNVKEFIIDGKLDEAGLDRIIQPAEKSVFHMCRLAAHYADMALVPDFVRYFRGEGYQVGVNLMGISLLGDEQIADAMQIIDRIRPDVFYVADSFGSMLPEDVSMLVGTLRKYYQGPLGIHTHDNQGLAFANSLRAIDEGVEYIDATLTGMGRGAGNLSTEQILLWLQNRGEDRGRYHSSRVLDIIHDFFQPLKEHYRWGFNYVYMLSGLNNTHPVYCMELCDGNKFSMSQISSILENIPRDKRASYNGDALHQSINDTPRATPGHGEALPLFNLQQVDPNSTSCIVVAPGPNVEHYREPVANLIKRRELAIVECNDSGILSEFPDRITAVLNYMRLAEIAMKSDGLANQILTGESRFDMPLQSNLSYFPCEIGDFSITESGLSIPDYEAGQYAISLALAMGYREIYLAGFNGYDDSRRNLPMDNYFAQVANLPGKPRLISITPGHYKHLQQRSIFSL